LAACAAAEVGVEDHPDIAEPGQVEQPLDAVGRGRDAEAGRAGQPVRHWVDAGHRAHTQRAETRRAGSGGHLLAIAPQPHPTRRQVQAAWGTALRAGTGS
jgi:hypothetical protein